MGEKSVVVLLSTYNGEKYLKEQIDSVLNQKGVTVSLCVRDDGSTDNTLPILEKYQNEEKIFLYKGQNIGYIKSFISLIRHAPDADYYALCDQDDVWDENKLFIAVEKIQGNEVESLYCSNARLVDEELRFISNENKKPVVSLKSAIVKNFATGCTIVFNKKLRERILVNEEIYISSHDSWLSRVCLAVGGNVYFDNEPHISYRQHKNNCVGSNDSYKEILKNRLMKLLKDKGHSRRKTAEHLLKYYGSLIDDDNKEFLFLVSDYYCNIRAKIKLIFASDISCGNALDDIQFKVAVLLNWV